MKTRASIFLLAWAVMGLASTALPEAADTNTIVKPEKSVTVDAPQTNAGPAQGIKELAAAIPANSLASNAPPRKSELEVKLGLAHQQRLQKDALGAAQTLESILTTNAPPEIQRVALYELAQVNAENNQLIRAQQILAQYLFLYPDDPKAPEVLLQQGLLYREMGVNTLAISKFYAVMSSVLKLKTDNVAYYKKVVVQAQTEIADTFFLDAKFGEAAEYFSRILKAGDAESSREILECKLIRSLSYLTNHVETIGKAQEFLVQFPKSALLPEVRFLLASALKNVGRNQDSMKQVMLLLQSQQENVGKDPETWIYWQRRAGNEIANQLYKDGDYLDALQIYQSLADLDKSPAWQVPVWYQSGMVYEQLQQWQKAGETYAKIISRQQEINASNTTPALDSLMEMARWRKNYIAWNQTAHANTLALESTPAVPSTPSTTPLSK